MDRDGVINEMVYVKDFGFVDSPSSPEQFKIIKGVQRAIMILKELGYKVIIISNQPGIAKGYYNKKTFNEITKKMHAELLKSKVLVDDQFYCFHHPNAKIAKYRKKCSCRKPSIGLIKKASKIHHLDLNKSYFIGDGMVDMEAAKKAGCKSIFVGGINSIIADLFSKKNLSPDYVARDLLDAVYFISSKQ